MNWLEETDNGIIIKLHIIPNAKKNEIIGKYNNLLKIKISSPPVDGAANKEIKRFLSKTFNISKSKIEILKGEKSKDKKIFIKDIKKTDIEKIVGGL